ncbi:hypothetical protein BDV96DRAFT_581901 [Lophiotrema nucula]|uniref:Uncharacterized protein n=1 Tax=Lophiotrema nucula TaxID=690887 RepID=A0A6A5YYF6_9PLEO|nr:hypothetical protein BDV96DRAFT_581901 [Lophiotrema nucula]
MAQRRARILGVEQGVDVTDAAAACPIIIPIVDDPTIGTGNDLNANFPKYWILTDGKQDIEALYFRMRDKACQNICDATTVQGVPSQFVRANRVDNTGCQYTIKIAEEKEAYFYATNEGQNCYDATEDMINAYGKSKDTSWINGPNPYEFYQIGIRDVNTIGPGSTTHDPFPLDAAHLGYMHLACRRQDKSLFVYDFQIRISNWDDGDYGKTIQRKGEDDCGLSQWKYEAEAEGEGLQYHDGSVSDHWSTFEMGILVKDRCGEKVLESVLGLKEGTVECPNGNSWYETLMFST